MPTTAALLKEVRALRARSGGAFSVPTDPLEFAAACGLPELDSWQQELLLSDSSRTLLNCCRQSGKSTLAALLALHKALTVPESLVLILAPALRQSQELFTKLSGFYRALDNPVPAHADRRLSLELANGSRIVTLPGSERTVRGFSGASLLIVDEAARVEDGLYYAVRPMLAVSGGSLIAMSTPFGKRGFFYHEYSEGEGWRRFEVSASEVPRIPPEFLEEERRSIGEWWYAQEYRCEFMEAVDSVFSSELIHEAITEEIEPLFKGA